MTVQREERGQDLDSSRLAEGPWLATQFPEASALSGEEEALKREFFEGTAGYTPDLELAGSLSRPAQTSQNVAGRVNKSEGVTCCKSLWSWVLINST